MSYHKNSSEREKTLCVLVIDRIKQAIDPRNSNEEILHML